MKQHYMDILEDAQRWFDSIDDIDKFLDDMLEYEKMQAAQQLMNF